MTGPRVAMIVAMGSNRAIGRDGALPWRLPGDLRFFKQTTMGKPVVMGRKTWESLPNGALPGRTNIVVTRDRAYRADGAEVVNDAGLALGLATAAALAAGADEVMVIGGAEIYARLLDRADRIYVTEVDAAPEADAFFPDLAERQWREIARTEPIREDGRPAYAFVTLERIRERT
ncbi:MAG: dihydrofolate reductase [Rhodospirillales bacterium]